jgi:hypothetical protein
MCGSSTFGAWMNHKYTWTHKTYHDLDLKKATIFSFITLFVINHMDYIQMSFCLRTPKLRILKLGVLTLWRAIIFFFRIWLRWGLKQNCSLHRDISNDMWHATCTHVFEGDSWLLMGTNQINTLIFDPFCGHNLCFKYSNESCEPILDIYVWRYLQWYKKHFNPMSFDP